jgi:hypothetical protein
VFVIHRVRGTAIEPARAGRETSPVQCRPSRSRGPPGGCVLGRRGLQRLAQGASQRYLAIQPGQGREPGRVDEANLA